MNQRGKFKIDLAEEFEYLPSAPIVEAVIHWRAAAEKKYEPENLLELLKQRLPNYPGVKQQHELSVGAEFGRHGSSTHFQSKNWQGIRLESQDKLQIGQFRRDGLVFSRLKPYPGWPVFEAEALKLWEAFREVFEPSQLNRLGVRFISRIEPVTVAELENYVESPPQCPASLELPFSEFLQQYTFDVPGHPYKARVVQTIQPESPPDFEHSGLILDIDVFTTRPQQIPNKDLQHQLAELRWLKNKLFFGCLKQEIIAAYKASAE